MSVPDIYGIIMFLTSIKDNQGSPYILHLIHLIQRKLAQVVFRFDRVFLVEVAKQIPNVDHVVDETIVLATVAPAALIRGRSQEAPPHLE